MVKYSTVPEIEECLKELDSAISVGGVEALVEIELLTPRLSALASSDAGELIRIFKEGLFTHSLIISALGGQASRIVVEFLKDTLLHHEDWDIRYIAASALSRMKDIDLNNAFVMALKDQHHLVRFTAVEYLEAHGDKRALPGLKEIIKDVDLQQSSPGLIDLAKKAISRLEQE
jgi:HEAT repeat protein